MLCLCNNLRFKASFVFYGLSDAIFVQTEARPATPLPEKARPTMHTRPVPGERPSAPSTPRRVGTVDRRTVAAAVVAWKEKGEMSGMLNVARQVIGLPLTQPGSVRAVSAHREGRGTRAPSQERCGNQEDPPPLDGNATEGCWRAPASPCYRKSTSHARFE